MGAPPERLQRPSPPCQIQAISPSWLPAVWQAPGAHPPILDLRALAPEPEEAGEGYFLGQGLHPG